MTPDQELYERLCDLRDLQAPPAQGMPRNPRRKPAQPRTGISLWEERKLPLVGTTGFEPATPTPPV